MVKQRGKRLGMMLFLLGVFLWVLPVGGALGADAQEFEMEIDTDPITTFVPGKRIRVQAEVEDPAGVKLVRCYFKAVGQADYVFVPMTITEGNRWQGILPAPSEDTPAISYLILAANNKDQVLRTQAFQAERAPADQGALPDYQQVASAGPIQVSTELAQAPAEVPGFTDSVTIDVVESSARFGFVATGIYTTTQIGAAGGTTGAAAAATSGGTVAASTGLSTGAMVGIGAGAAAVVGGGIAVAAGGGGGDDPPAPEPEPTVSGSWQFQYTPVQVVNEECYPGADMWKYHAYDVEIAQEGSTVTLTGSSGNICSGSFSNGILRYTCENESGVPGESWTYYGFHERELRLDSSGNRLEGGGTISAHWTSENAPCYPGREFGVTQTIEGIRR